MSGELDVEAVLRRRDKIVHGLDDSDQIPWLNDRNVTVFRGRGRSLQAQARHGDEPLPVCRVVDRDRSTPGMA